MRTLAMNDDDIYFSKGELAMVEGIDEVDQTVKVLMKINKGEWFINTEEGLDYELLYDKMVSDDRKRAEIYNRLMSEGRISSVESIEFTRNRRTRTLQIDFRAVTTEGETVEGEVVPYA